MKILMFLHAYPPDHNAGAEWMAHTINKFLVSRGHEVKVMTRGGDAATIKNGVVHYRPASKKKFFEGIEVFKEGINQYAELFKWADLVFTHLDMTGKAINLSKQFHKKLVHLIHNTHYNDVLVRINPRNQYMVYNAEWTRLELRYPHDGIVVHPPINYKDYVVKPEGKNITLINCYAPKGGDVMPRIAEKLNHRKFIGVMGYGDQTIEKRKNITYLENTPAIKDVYKKTRILLMPSEYESFGRVAIEASSSGIPVICTDTPGLREALDYAGVFIKDRDNIDEWVDKIRMLDDAEVYDKLSTLGKRRAKEITKKSETELLQLEEFLKIVHKKRYYEM